MIEEESNPAASASSLPGLKLTSFIWALLFARWLIPAEATMEGGTLWLAMVTAGTASVWALVQSRRDSASAYRDRWDRAVWALVIVHVAAAACVLLTVGQKRLALNMLWEWTGVGLQFFLLRQTLRTASRRQTFITASVVIWTLLAAYGVWQHFVAFPQNVAVYEAQRAEYDALREKAATNPAEARKQQARMESIRRDWVAQGVPLEGKALGLFERRLRDSHEPLAFFALANSLGGMLASSLLLLVVTTQWREILLSKQRARQLAGPVVAVLVIALCLLLTKSRTAWVGSLCGLSFWGCLALWQRYRVRQQVPIGTTQQAAKAKRVWQRGPVVVGAAVVVVLLLLVSGVIALGGLDVEVLSEAPKSLRYRLEYWTGSARIVQEHPWLGIGPGNFRAHYLRHKLASASEEIADPHSFIFDVLTSSGLLGGLALLWLLGLFAVSVWKTSRTTLCNESNSVSEKPMSTERCGSLAIAFGTALIVTYQFVIEAVWNTDVVLMGSSAAACMWYWESKPRMSPSHSEQRALQTGAMLAILSLLVHLLGAGGFSSPAILNWLLALMAVLSFSLSNESSTKPEYSPRVWLIAALSYAGVALAIARLGWLPVLQAQGLHLQGDIAVTTPGQLDTARELFHQAHQADPLSTRSLISLAEIEFRASQNQRDEARFETALRMAQQVRSEDPVGGQVPTMLGRWYRERWQQRRDPEDAAQCVKWYEAAIKEYPTNPFWTADLALAYQAAEQVDAARSTAQRALEFQTINERAGHLDRLLNDDVLRKLTEIASE